MNPIKSAPESNTPNADNPGAWLSALEENLSNMKSREEEYRRKANDALLREQTINDERSKLELLLYKAGLRK